MAGVEHRAHNHDSVGTSLGGGSDLMYATSRQIVAGCSAPPNDGIPFGRPSAIDRKMSASAPPYRQRPSVRLGPTAPTAPPPWQPSQFMLVNNAAPSSAAFGLCASELTTRSAGGMRPPANTRLSWREITSALSGLFAAVDAGGTALCSRQAPAAVTAASKASVTRACRAITLIRWRLR
jgi:hypothetical protein